MNKRVVVALGGNAILQPKQAGTAEVQFENVYNTCVQLAALIEAGYQLVITHGNGPQVGNILLQNEEAKDKIPPMPLDVCGSQTRIRLHDSTVDEKPASPAPCGDNFTKSWWIPATALFKTPQSLSAPFTLSNKLRSSWPKRVILWLKTADGAGAG